MGMEIERKFLVDQKIWQPGEQGISVRQGYLAGEGPLLVRIRQQDRKAFLTLKGRTTGISRLEFEYEIPMVDAVGLLRLCQQPLVEKVRYVEEFEGHTWEIDRFFGSNEGLMIAEIELTSEERRAGERVAVEPALGVRRQLGRRRASYAGGAPAGSAGRAVRGKV